MLCLRLGACGHDLGAHVGVLLEVLHKAGGQLLAACLIRGLVLPGVLRDQQLGGHTLDAGGHLHAEGGIGDELALLDLAGKGGGDHGAGVAELHALAGAVPAGIDQIDLGAGLLHLVRQHRGVHGGIQRQERLAEAGGECGHRLGDADLRTGDLGGEAGDEVVHGLVLIQLADGRQHAVGIRRQEDDGLGDAGAHAGQLGVGDILHRIAHAGVDGQRIVVEVELAGVGIHHHVLHQSAKLDGVVDLRLALGAEVDALGVAAALEVEHGIVRPAVLVIADEHAVGVGGQGGLAGTGQAEEHGAVAVLADVGGAVHGEHALLGQHIVHNGEHGLLDLAGIPGAADHHLVRLVVHQDGGLAAGAVDLRDALEAGSGDDGVVLVEVLQLLGGGTAQQLVDEEVLAGQLVDDAEGFGILGIGAGKAVENKDLLALQIGDDLGADGVKLRLLDGAVHLAPGDVVMDSGSIDNELVVGAAAGVFTGLDHQRAGVGQSALAAAERMLGQLRGSEIAIDSLGIDDAQLFQSVSFHLQNLLCKMSSRRKWRAAFLYVDYTIRLGQLTVLFCIFPKNFSVSLKVFYHFFSHGGSIPFSLQKNFLYERIPPRCNNVNLAIFCFYGAARHGKEYTLHKIPARPAA